MFVIYVLGLYFSFFTHKDIYGSEHKEEIESKWLEGVQLVAVYIIIAICFLIQ
jgi:Ca2+:H+ antiporter